MSTRFFPVSIRIDGDAGISDAEAMREIADRLKLATELARREHCKDEMCPVADLQHGAPCGSNLYTLQSLDPAQFVVAPAPAHVPRVTIKRSGGYDPALGSDHPSNQDPTLPPPKALSTLTPGPTWEPPGGLKRPTRRAPNPLKRGKR